MKPVYAKKLSAACEDVRRKLFPFIYSNIVLQRHL